MVKRTKASCRLLLAQLLMSGTVFWWLLRLLIDGTLVGQRMLASLSSELSRSRAIMLLTTDHNHVSHSICLQRWAWEAFPGALMEARLLRPHVGPMQKSKIGTKFSGDDLTSCHVGGALKRCAGLLRLVTNERFAYGRERSPSLIALVASICVCSTAADTKRNNQVERVFLLEDDAEEVLRVLVANNEKYPLSCRRFKGASLSFL